jgi:hypothetical protein
MLNAVGDAAKGVRATLRGAISGELRCMCVLLAILDDLEMARRQI